MEQIMEILPSVIAGGILAIIIVLIIMSKIRERKHGSCSCGCSGCNGSCPHCSAAGIEHKEEN